MVDEKDSLMNAATALSLLVQTQMRPFNSNDYTYWSGVESANPMIGENGDYLIIADGTEIQIFRWDEDEAFCFSLRSK